MTKRKLIEFTDDTFGETQEQWKAQAGNEEFDSEYSRIFEWVDTHRNYEEDMQVAGSRAYGLFLPPNKVACAIVDVVSHKKGRNSTTKLLKIYVNPTYWEVAQHQKAVIEIFASAIIGTIKLSKQAAARTVKLFGRSDQLLSLLHTIHVYMNERKKEFPGVACAMKGRWLEIATI